MAVPVSSGEMSAIDSRRPRDEHGDVQQLRKVEELRTSLYDGMWTKIGNNMHEMRTEFRDGMQRIEGAQKRQSGEIQDMRTDIHEMRTHMQQIEGAQKRQSGDMRKLLTEFREMRTEFREMRTEFRDEMREMRTEFRSEIQEVRTEMRDLVRQSLEPIVSAANQVIHELNPISNQK
jgi:predicted  nucleic acid-binding Zn-ribbon protein